MKSLKFYPPPYRVFGFILALGCAIGTQANDKLTSDIRLDLLNYKNPPKLTKAKEAFKTNKTLSVYIKYNNFTCIDSLRMLGAEIETVTKSILTAKIPIDAIETACNLSGVDCIQSAQRASFQMDKARISTGVDKVQAGEGVLNTPFLGKNVIIGVIDGGADFTHPAFYTSDRSALRIKRVWDQDDEKGTPPEGYSYGAEYATPEAITQKGTDYEYFSHGSHVMGIAAGADISNGNPYYGIARESDLVFSSFLDIDTGISDAISYIYNYADEQNMPAVINMSLGTAMGPHDGTSLRDVLADELTGEGRLIVGAAGNNGMIDMHISKTFTESDKELLTGIAFLEGFSGVGELQVWGEAGKTFKVQICTVDKETMKPVYKSRAFDASKSVNTVVTLQKPFDQSSGSFTIVTQTSPLNNRPMAHIQLSISEYKPNKVIGLIITSDDNSTVHAWTNETYCCFKQFLPVMDIPDNHYGVCEIGGTGKNIITVGSYTTKETVKCLDGNEFASGFKNNELASYSNVGPTVDGRMKPDIAAPGSCIVSAFNGFESNNASWVSSGEWNGKKYYYGVYQGTSMASPHVTGILATWLQAYPSLSPQQVREVLSATAVKDTYTGSVPNNSWGYGKIDAYNGLVYILKNFVKNGGIENLDENTDWAANITSGKLKILYFDTTEKTDVRIYTTDGSLVNSYTSYSNECGDEKILDMHEYSKGMYIIDIRSSNQKQTIKYLN